MNNKRVVILVSISLLTLAAIWWRWVWLPPSDLVLIPVQIDLPQREHPLDTVLRDHASFIGSSPALLAQFRRPAETFFMAGLQVDACEVTQGEFRLFANWRATQINPPEVHRATPEDWEFKSQTENHQLLGQLDVAAGGLSFYDAWAYCHAGGGRLPTAAEFEAIASGNEQRLYAWGDEFDDSAWPNIDPSLNIAKQCAEFPTSDTPQGVHEFGSSLLEWVTDEAGLPLLMGGNAWHRPRRLHALNFIRRPTAADFRSPYTGFRCVYNRQPPADLTQVPLPWGEVKEAVPIIGGQYTIGPPQDSRIVPLLQALRDESIGVLKYLPLVPTELDIRVMKHEVSRELYARFLRDPLVRLGFFNHPNQPSHIHHEPDNWAEQRQQPSYPVTRVSWWSAWSFARWAGGELPTAEQWQILAGASLERFPYGNEYVEGRAVDRNYPQEEEASEVADETSGEALNERQSIAVTASTDDSAHGIIGFGGNVAEWTSTSVLRGNAFTLVIKGGSYLMPAEGSQIVQTSEAVPDYRAEDLGFRLVFPPSRSR
ncbi:MAG: formylglycine-generating enzyme family protein [Pseudohongiellaceae bacterium]